MTATKKSDFNGLLGIAGIAVAGWGLYKFVLPKLDPPAHLVPENTAKSSGTYAFVNNPSGAMLFAHTDPAREPLYGHGREPLSIKLGDGTYVGKLTGITYEELAQVRTNIEGKDVSFWIKKEDIRTGTSDQFDMSSVLQKTQADLRNIAHSLIDKIKL